MSNQTVNLAVTETEAPQRTPWVFEIDERNYDALVEKFDKLVRRARKCSFPPPRFEVIHEMDQEVAVKELARVCEESDMEDGFGNTYSLRGPSWMPNLGGERETKWVRYLYVTVEGHRPQIAGWDFIATLDHTEQDAEGIGVVVKSVPGVTHVPIKYRTGLPVCEHCHTARRRNETFVIRNAAGVTKQIGRNCLGLYFPGQSPEEVAAQLQWWTSAVELAEGAEDEDSLGGGGGRQYYRLPIEDVLAVTQAIIECDGWKSKTRAREELCCATADSVRSLYFNRAPFSREFIQWRETIFKRAEERKAEIEKMVADSLEWVRNLSPEESEDYLYNLWVVCRSETVRSDRLGLVCSLMAAYRRHLEGERKKAERATRPPSQYVGELGKRNLFRNCECKHIGEPFEGSFGVSRRVLFLQDGHKALVWYSSGDGGIDFEIGTCYDLVGTPRKHEEKFNRYLNAMEKTTTINRVAKATEKDFKNKKYNHD